MEHLNFENVIEFVSFDKLNDESIKKSAEVNAHLAECEACRKIVRAAQLLYDEMLSECRDREIAKEKLAETLGEQMGQF
ncbi:MAG: hypothetical protein IJA60_02225 [Clostridia bacterium]|nr:hypothetical protein [Clostridia bacterium]